MLKNNKKGFNLHMLLALAIFVIVTITMTAIQIEKATVKNRPIGSAQTAILQAAAKGDSAIIYLDKAGSLASEESEKRFLEEAACQPDIETDLYTCGAFAGTCSWSDGETLCVPDFEKSLLFFFQSELFPILSRNTFYSYPSFSLVAKPMNDKTTILAAREEKLVFNFQGGGIEGFKLLEKSLFSPDYLNAKVTTQLNSGLRNGKTINHIVVNYTAGGTLSGAVRTLEKRGVSYHYIIDTNGDVYQFVPESRSAYHAGCKLSDTKCLLPGMNQQSIGISFVNCGYLEECGGREAACYTGKEINGKCWQEYSEKQLNSFVTLVSDIVSRTPSLYSDGKMKVDTLVMHSDITKRKEDPGIAFTNRLTEIEQKINKEVEQTTTSVSISNINTEETPNVESGRGYTGVKLTASVQERVESYDSIINKYAEKYDIEPALIKAFITHESRGIARRIF